MTIFTSRRGSPDPIDSLLSGIGVRELGTGYEAVAQLLLGLADAGGNVAAAPHAQLGIANIPVGLISTMAETVRMNQPRSPLWRRLRFVGASGVTKLLIVGGVLVGGTAAAAATGSLPSPIQHSVTRVLSAIGIEGSGHAVPTAAKAARQAARPGSTLPVTGVRCPSTTATPAKPITGSGTTTLVKGLPRSCAPGLHHKGKPTKRGATHRKRPVLGRGLAGGSNTTTTVGDNAGTVHKSGPKKTKAEGKSAKKTTPAGQGKGAKKTKAESKGKGAKKTTPAGHGKGAKKTTSATKGKGAKKTTPASKGKGAKKTTPATKGKGAKKTTPATKGKGANKTTPASKGSGVNKTTRAGKSSGGGAGHGSP